MQKSVKPSNQMINLIKFTFTIPYVLKKKIIRWCGIGKFRQLPICTEFSQKYYNSFGANF